MSTDGQHPHDPSTPEEAPDSRDGGGVTIGNMSGGSIATGRHGTATSYNTTGTAADPRYTELLRAVRVLRDALPPAADRSADDAALDGELADAEAEIAGSGTADTGRLTRLLGGVRTWLASQGAAVGAMASATAVIQGAAQLLG
ncbi:hypothetical protein ACIPPJ_00220 [Streptomyces sp. NPDC086091]|uniref:hypothetical protein n=1 Tax=Streptomyces sp. NPDC086091 TaxID=3365751 RepID=UPI0038128F6C